MSSADDGFRPLEVSFDECDGSFERMFRRFVRRTRDDGILKEFCKRARGFEKPSVVRRRKASSEETQ